MHNYDEEKASAAIRELPQDACLHLKHVYRNGLQCIVGKIEMKQYEGAKEEIFSLSEKLRGVGL